MKVILATLGASLLIACGSEPGAKATIYVDAPMGGDNSCVGVAGFEVIVSPTGQAQQTKKLRAPSTFVDPSACALPEPFDISDLEIDSAVTVTVNGYDGSGTKVRVTGRQTIQSLRQGPVRLQLVPAPPVLPLLVFERGPHLQGAQVKDLRTISITTAQMGGTSLLSANRDTAGVFMDPEPGAYGIQQGLLSVGLAINVSFTVATGQMIRDARLDVGMDTSGRYFTAK